jgi:agmatine deiminase
MPGEFEPHDGCWMLWPERPDNWHLGGETARAAFAEVAEVIARFEALTVGVSRPRFDEARGTLSDAVCVVEIPYDDAWIRDTGPTFVANGEGAVRGVVCVGSREILLGGGNVHCIVQQRPRG